VPGLLLILCEAGTERFAAAIEVAAVTAALDRPVRVLLRGPLVRALGQPVVAKACDLLFELGADVAICQTAMAANGLSAADLPPGIEAHGMTGFLAGREDWQLLIL